MPSRWGPPRLLPCSSTSSSTRSGCCSPTWTSCRTAGAGLARLVGVAECPPQWTTPARPGSPGPPAPGTSGRWGRRARGGPGGRRVRAGQARAAGLLPHDPPRPDSGPGRLERCREIDPGADPGREPALRIRHRGLARRRPHAGEHHRIGQPGGARVLGDRRGEPAAGPSQRHGGRSPDGGGRRRCPVDRGPARRAGHRGGAGRAPPPRRSGPASGPGPGPAHRCPGGDPGRGHRRGRFGLRLVP